MKPFADEAAIVSGEYDMAPLSHCSDDAKDLIQNLLKMDPDERLTVDQVLAHPFVTKGWARTWSTVSLSSGSIFSRFWIRSFASSEQCDRGAMSYSPDTIAASSANGFM